MTALSYQPVQVTPTLRIQGPLTRRGDPGPGLLIIQDAATEPVSRPTLDPEPLRKWAEEGYTVVRIEVSEHHTLTEEDFRQALSALTRHDKFAVGSIAIIAYSMSSIPTLSMAMELGELGMSLAVGAVVYYGSLPGPVNHPHICHLAESGIKSTSDNGTTHRYPEANSASFVLPSHPDYLPASAAVAHSRTLEFLKKQLDGPWFDLEAIWEEHTRLEFADRAVEATMNTMVQEPYVNHIPTMTGGIGRDALTGFYANHFIFSNPEDTELQLISRTVGVDRVVDEFIFSFTHDRGIDWLIPGIPPTGKKLKIPFTAVVNIRGDRLYHEHIAWDQLTVLFQLGLMPDYLPFPYPVAGHADSSKKLEYRVPGAGHEVAEKLIDESAVPSNGMFEYAIREVPF